MPSKKNVKKNTDDQEEYKVFKINNTNFNRKQPSQKLDLPKLKPENKKSSLKPASMFMSIQDLKKKTENLIQIPNKQIIDLKLGSRLVYFEVMDNNGKMQFKYKSGGNLINNGYPDYLYVTNGKNNWSIQLKNHVIFKLENQDEQIKNLENKISLLTKENKKLKESTKILKKDNKKLYKYIEKKM
jgi:hypothetical protein